MQATKEQAAAAAQVVLAVGDAIKELGSVPAGELYANVMGHMELRSFDAVIDALVGAGLVRRDGSHMLTWTGPR